jgi:hypothetical protein
VRWDKKFLALHRTEHTMQYQQRDTGFPGLSDGGTQRQSSEQPMAAPGTGSGQFSWSGVVPPRLEEIAMRGNGLVLALVLSLLGFAGYFLFALAGVAGITMQTDAGPAQVSWDPSIGALLSIGGCAACAIAAIVMLHTRTLAPSEPR